MIIHLLHLVLGRSLLALLRSVISAIVEAVAQPVGTRKLCPYYMVGEQLARFDVHHVNLLPVASAAGYDIGKIASVVGKRDILQSHRTVVAQLVGIEKHTLLAAQTVHLVEHGLVLHTVVLVNIPFAVLLKRRIHLLVVHHLLQSPEILVALRNLRQISIRHPVFCLYPCRRGSTRVVLQRAERVSHLHSEILIHSSVLRSLRIPHSLSVHSHGRCSQDRSNK